MIHILQANPGNGKTLLASEQILFLLNRNKKWWKNRSKMGITKKRIVATNITVSDEIKRKHEGFIVEYDGLRELVELRGCDIIFDDMGTYLDAQRWLDVPDSVKKWFRLHEHYGINIYGNCQEFKDLANVVRKLTVSLKHVVKIAGSARPHETKPKVRRVWGFMLVRPMDITTSEKDFDQRKYDNFMSWRIKTIKQIYCNIYDTTQDFKKPDYPELEHIERVCPVSHCKKHLDPMVKHV